MSRSSPEELVAHFRQGDTHALQKVLRLYRKEIHYFIWNMLKDRQTADEIVNDSFLKAWNTRHTFSSLGEIRSFLYAVTRNDCLNFLKSPRGRRLENLEEIGYLLNSDEDVEARMIYSELLGLVYEEVEKLPEKQRRVFQLAFFEGLSTEEIADELGISPNAVFINKSNALKTIRRVFDGNILLSYSLFFLVNGDFWSMVTLPS